MPKNRFKIKRIKRQRRAARTRSKIFGTKQCPRLSIFRSAKHIYAQLINDEKGETLASASDLELKGKMGKGAKANQATSVGQLIAKKAQDLKMIKVVFDKGGYQYHGRVKNVAEGARQAGLKF